MALYPQKTWFTTSSEKRIKIQVILATTVALITTTIAIHDYTKFITRQQAYETILKQRQLKNDEAVLVASKTFLTTTSILRKDERTPQVMEIYRDSLLRWIAQQPGDVVTPKEQSYIDFLEPAMATH